MSDLETRKAELEAQIAALEAEMTFTAAKDAHQKGKLGDDEWHEVKLELRESRRAVRELREAAVGG